MATAWLQRIMDGAVLRRLSTEPILVPVPGDAKEVGGVLNPGVVREKDGLLMLYRAVDAEGQSRLRAAVSDDGFCWERTGITFPADRWPGTVAAPWQLEDPRLTRMDSGGGHPEVVMACTEFDGGTAHIGLYSCAPPFFLRLGHVPTLEWDKDGALFPARRRGRYMLLRRPHPNVVLATAPSLTGAWEDEGVVLAPRAEDPDAWDCAWVGAGAPPIRTPEGWFLLYHGVDRTRTYRLGGALLALDDPLQVLWRSPGDRPLLEPELPWERDGVVGNVVFSCAALPMPDGRLWCWYGGADRVIGVAAA